jgi:hypothetical protein
MLHHAHRLLAGGISNNLSRLLSWSIIAKQQIVNAFVG